MEERAPAETAKRVRAALAYANIDVKDAKVHTGISYATMARIVSASNPRGASLEELYAVADGTGVPRDFLEHGFYMVDADADVSLAERVRALESQMAVLLRRASTRIARDAAAAAQRQAPREGREDEPGTGHPS